MKKKFTQPLETSLSDLQVCFVWIVASGATFDVELPARGLNRRDRLAEGRRDTVCN